MIRLWHAVAAVLLCTPLLFAQTPAPAQKPATTIRSNARLVVVDVVVTDKNEQAVKGLQQGDFTILEDGKAQRIVGFEEHSIANTTSSSLQPPPKLTQNTFTNATLAPADVPINIVLIDALNTDFSDQAQGRNALIKFLKTLPQGQRMALFVLGGDLRMLQGFTGDSDTLIKAATEFKPELSVARTAEMDLRGFNSEMERLSIGLHSPLLASTLGEVLSAELEFRTTSRVYPTIQAFKQIARASSAYPGRKNLIWLSGGFPLYFHPGSIPITSIAAPSRSSSTSFNNELQQVAHLLATAKVAVYPVDIRGLASTVPQADARLPKASSTGFNTFSDLSESYLLDTQSTMREIARETGGRAFYNRNDLDIAMRRSVELGSVYYTIAYAPANTKWDGSFRKISVKLHQKDVHLNYRSGYYAFTGDTPVERKLLQSDIAVAMERFAPLATDITVQAGAKREVDGTVKVQYFFDGRKLRLHDENNNPVTAKYIFAIVAWDSKGKVAGQTNEAWQLPADEASIAKIETQGWGHSQTIKLAPGATRIRVAIQDQTTGKIGSLDIPMPTS